MWTFAFPAAMLPRVALVVTLVACWCNPGAAQAIRPIMGDPFAPVFRDEPPAQPQAEPFGLERSTLTNIGLQKKWRGVEHALLRENGVLARCRADRESCPPEADKFLAIIDKALTREGWARIGEINRAINLLITATEDQTQHGVADHWATPLATFAAGKGDCEDYAIAKYVALREVGVAAADLRLVVVYDHAEGEYHAVAATRFEGRWVVLDNRTLMMRRDAELTHYKPLFVIDGQGVRRLVPPKLRREPAPDAAVATATVEAPSPYAWWVDFTM